ncbi:MAG: phosphoribosyl-ATP diphosphatase [Myxococcota bacterium]|jgi:phosphoribosyl-ATP pyrophosphohydrolase|nr:phosphoribosyl-ATP diphosphatase [Myxococcota bacterium]
MAKSEILDRLFEVIEARRLERPEDSYVVSLLDGGVEAMAAKVREEAEETIEAVAAGDSEHSAREFADLIFHAWVLLAGAGLRPSDVYRVLEERFGVGGLAEKAAREGDPIG